MDRPPRHFLQRKQQNHVCENNRSKGLDRSTKLKSDVMDVTMDVVAEVSGCAEESRNGKRSIDDISDNACSDAQSAAGNSSNKKACLPRRVSTIPGDGSTEAAGVSSTSTSTIVPTSNSIVLEPRRPMIRRASN